MKKALLYCIIVFLAIYISLISFADEFIPVDLSEKCTIEGYVTMDEEKAPKSGFKIEILGTNVSAVTDQNGKFSINIPKSDSEHILRISKPGFLTRDINIDYLDNSLLNTAGRPFEMWAGDIPKNGEADGVINFSDVVSITAAFNSVLGDSIYVESCDLNRDKSINISDIVLLAKHFNATKDDYEKPYIILPKALPSGKVEAEKMTLNGYAPDNYQGTDCAKIIDNIGTCSFKFSGITGFYDINIRYLDEDSGQSKMGLYINGSSEKDHSWKLDADDNTWKTITFKNILLNAGDKISVQGNKDGLENNRIDYIETVLQTVPTPRPTPIITTIKGTLYKSYLDGIFYMINGYSLSNFYHDMDSLVGQYIEVRGYVENYEIYIGVGKPFKVISYKILSDSTPAPTSTTQTPTPTKAPEAVTLIGKLVWYDFEGGFWGLIAADGEEYCLLGDRKLIENASGGYMNLVEVTGYSEPGTITFYMRGIPFKVISIKPFNSTSNSTPVPTSPTQTPTPKPTPTKVPEAVTLIGRLVWNNLEGGFWELIAEDGKVYCLLGDRKLIESALGSYMDFVKVTGYSEPGTITFYMHGIPFKVISIEPYKFN